MKNTNKKGIIAILLIVLIVLGVSIFFIIRNSTKNVIDQSNPVSDDRYVILKYTSDSNFVKVTQLFVFDVNNVCKNTRSINEALTEEANNHVQKMYEMLLEGREIYKQNNLRQLFSNIELKDNILKYNSNEWIGQSKDIIIQKTIEFADENKVEIIEL